MSDAMIFIGLAVILIGMLLIVPHMMRLRIRFLRFLRWNWLANLHENHFDRFVVIARLILAIMAMILLALGSSGESESGPDQLI